MGPCFFRKFLGVAVLLLIAAGGVLKAEVSINDTASCRASSGDEALVEQAVREATSRIQKLAVADSGAFAAVLREAFGLRLRPEVERDLVEKAAHRQLPFPGRVLFVPADVLPHAAAAYAREDGGVIFLNTRFRTDASALTALILHEWGHHLDAFLGPGESPREEGEIFLLGVNRGAPIPAALPHSSGALVSSHAVIQFQSRMIPVECWPDWFDKATSWVGGAMEDLTKKATDTLENIASKGAEKVVETAQHAGRFLKNTGEAAGNAIKGTAQGIAAVVLTAVGDEAGAAALLAASEDSFNSAGDNLKGTANNVLDVAAAASELYDQVKTELDKTGLPLGTVADFAAGSTPMAPYLAAIKGITDIKNAVENGGDIEAAVAAATADFTLSVVGRTAKGIKRAKGPENKAGFFDRIKTVLTAGKNKATQEEINLGIKLIRDYPEVVKIVETLNKLKKLKTGVKVGNIALQLPIDNQHTLGDALVPPLPKKGLNETVNTVGKTLLPGSVVALGIPGPTPDPAQPLVAAEQDRIALRDKIVAENKKAITDIHEKAKADAHEKAVADGKAKAKFDAKARAEAKAKSDMRAKAKEKEEEDYFNAVQQANKWKRDETNRRRQEDLEQTILEGLNQIPQQPDLQYDPRYRQQQQPQPRATPCDDCPGGKYYNPPRR